MDLKDTVSIVTGGSGGLGGRICHALADEGSHVAVVYNSRPENASAVASELRAKGVEAETYRCDVASPEQVEGVVSNVIQRFRRVDSLVNDAAYNKWIPFSDLDKMTLDECGQDDIDQPHRADDVHEGRRRPDEGPGLGPNSEHLLRGRDVPERVVDRLRRLEGRAQSPDALHGRGAGAGDTGELHRLPVISRAR